MGKEPSWSKEKRGDATLGETPAREQDGRDHGEQRIHSRGPVHAAGRAPVTSVLHQDQANTVADD
jgi:hypothetical protein